MTSEYFYRFSEKAAQDLEDILQYISNELCNPQAAQNLGRKIFEKIDNVRIFPESGPLVQNEFLADKDIRKIIVDNYIVYYKVQKDKQTIYIVRIVYGKRDLEEIEKRI